MEGCTCEVCVLSRANRRQAEMIKELQYQLRVRDRQLIAATTTDRWWQGWWPRRKEKEMP